MINVYTYDVPTTGGQAAAILQACRMLRAAGERPGRFRVAGLAATGDGWSVTLKRDDLKR